MTWLRWPGWRHLPREPRDILFLLAVIGWTVLPHTAHLPVWCTTLLLVVLVWRALLALRTEPLPSRWLLFGVLAVAVGLTFVSHGTLLGRDAGVTLLVVLMALKTLELRARRDALVVFFLGFFLVLTNLLYSQSIAIAAAMLVSVWGLLTALVLAHMPVGQPGLGQASRLAARASLLGAPLMVVLFLLFPRFGPLWALPQDATGTTGLSGNLRLGGVAELALDDSIAFRVRFDGNAPPLHQLYWRGPVLSAYDGIEWRRGTLDDGPSAPRRTGAAVAYEMTLEPSRLAVVPLLELAIDAPSLPEGSPQRVRPRGESEWSLDGPPSERLRLQAQAWPLARANPAESPVRLAAQLQLPSGRDLRMQAWARAFRAQQPPGADARALSDALLRHITTGGYGYTLSAGTYGDPAGRDAVDAFWLDGKQGFCEHFASSYVIAMRAMGVPARIVTGYQGADPVLQDGYVVVRNSHAHAWAEYWLGGVGWVRVDPTSAVAPDRVNRSRQLVAQPGLVAEALNRVDPQLLARLRGVWERLDNRWNQWVLNYSRSRQFDLLETLGVRAPSWQDLARVLVFLLSGTALAGAGWAWWDRHRRDPWQRLHQGVCERLSALGIEAAAHEAPRRLAQRVRQALGPRGAAVAHSLDVLDELRYGREERAKPDPGWWRAFRSAAAKAQRSG